MPRRYVPPHLRQSVPPPTSASTKSTKCTKPKNFARRRLARDLVELERANISSIAAHPIDDDIFEWHVNIQPTDGVYCGVYFHLIMIFPDSYPSKPPTIKICTPISHPNIFNSFLCLSMLRSHTQHVPYEGWSAAYSITSILMQLQSFLFAEKIDQDGGYQANARLSNSDVKSSIKTCKTFECYKCNHSHSTPWPQIQKRQKVSQTLINIYPTDPHSNHVMIQGSFVQTTHTYWVGAKGEYGYNKGKILYEAKIKWIGGRRNNTRGGLCRFGFGSQDASICGCDIESFGYGGTAMFSYNNKYEKFGKRFTENDTITVGIDFNSGRIYFAKNGILMEPNRKRYIPHYLKDKLLYPLLAFKNSAIEFNFSTPKTCGVLVENGFKSLNDTNIGDIDWNSEYIIPELWVVIFEGLLFEEIFSAQFVCKAWYDLINKYNVMERSNEICCYYTKARINEGRFGKILGIGLSIRGSNVAGFGIAIHSQMDILSLDAWNNGCRTGVWGEALTHFLPLIINRKHAEFADTLIKYHLQSLTKIFCTVRRSNANELERCINRSDCLKVVDALVTMMNLIVSQFVMGHKNDDHTVSMVMCEKVVLGYCAFHHLLLYLISQNKHTIIHFANKVVSLFINNGSHQQITKDLGKFLIYLMISQYGWNDVAHVFVKESLTRDVLWMFQDVKYSKYDTTNIVEDRLQNTFVASNISRRLIMFQVWFMKNNASETLQGYNHRLGRPKIKVRKCIFNKTKFILNSKSWCHFFNELDIIIEDEKAMDQLLRFAIYNSDLKGYHRHCSTSGPIQVINPPQIRVKNCKIGDDSTVTDGKPIRYYWRNNKGNQSIEPQRSMCNVQSEKECQQYDNDIFRQQMRMRNNKNGKQPQQQSMSKSQRRKMRKKKTNKSNQYTQRRRQQTWMSPIRPQPQAVSQTQQPPRNR